MRHKLLLKIILVIGVSLLAFWWWHEKEGQEEESQLTLEEREETFLPTTLGEEQDIIDRVEEESVQEKEYFDPLDTPFIVQAPFGEWSNPYFENGCEEASMLMVASLLEGKMSVLPDEAKQELLKIAAYEEKVFGHAVDTDAQDTRRILYEYFDIEGQVLELDQEQELQTLLQAKNILLLPADGKKLGNPFFTAPGPETHMLVVLAYDVKTGEYVVHDPGTKRGEQYRYAKQTLWDAAIDYPSGPTHLPKIKKEKRVVAISLEKAQNLDK